MSAKPTYEGACFCGSVRITVTGAPVAMGYVETAFSADGTEIDLIVRGKPMPARVAPIPFVPHRYRRAV